MNKTILLGLILLIPMISFGQDTSKATRRRAVVERSVLTGTVTNQKGEALPAASIFIHDVRAGAIADQNGMYRTPSISPGRYLVEVTHQGYSSAIEAVTISGNTTHDFVLNTIIVEQEGVTVTGVSSATRLRQSPQPVSLFRRSDLLRTTSNNLIEALTRKSGVSAISTGPAIAKPVIRGLSSNRVVTINDGVRQEGQQWGDEHGIEIDEYSVQRVEILKGPASLMYGSDAMAGVINIITNQPVEKGAFRGSIIGNSNTNNRLVGLNANLAAHFNSGFNWNLYYSQKSAADYKNKYDGTVFNSRFNEKNAGGYIGINKDWGFSHLLFSKVSQRLGIIEGDRDSATGRFIAFPETAIEHIVTTQELKSRTVQTPFQTVQHTKIASDNSFRIGGGRLTAIVGYQANERKEFGDPFNKKVPDVYFDLKTVNYNFTYHLAEKNGWRTSFGVNGMYQQNRNKGEEKLIPEYNQFDIGSFVYTRKSYDKLTVSGGIRGDSRQLDSKRLMDDNGVKFAAFNRNFGDFSGSVGVAYELSKAIILKGNIARGFRAPSIAELSSNGAHEGTNRYEYGQQNLKTETSLQADAGFELNTEHFSLGLNAYYNSINNYVFYRKLESTGGGDSLVNVDGEDIAAFRFDQSAARLAGFEANFDVHPHPLDWLHFENTLSFVSGTFTHAIEATNRLPFIPAPRLLSELRADFAKAGKSFGNLYFKAELDATASRNKVFTAYDTETPTPGYVLFNLGTGADINSKGNKLFSVYFALNNVTDVAYQSHLSRLKYAAVNNVTGRQGVFNMGRNFNVRLHVPFDFRRNK